MLIITLYILRQRKKNVPKRGKLGHKGCMKFIILHHEGIWKRGSTWWEGRYWRRRLSAQCSFKPRRRREQLRTSLEMIVSDLGERVGSCEEGNEKFNNTCGNQCESGVRLCTMRRLWRCRPPLLERWLRAIVPIIRREINVRGIWSLMITLHLEVSKLSEGFKS